MQIRINTDELISFKNIINTELTSVHDLCYLIEKVLNRVMIDDMKTSLGFVSQIEDLRNELYELRYDMESYLDDIDMCINEFFSTDIDIKNKMNSIFNYITHITEFHSTRVAANQTINSSLVLDNTNRFLNVLGVNDKKNVAVNLEYYNYV